MRVLLTKKSILITVVSIIIATVAIVSINTAGNSGLITNIAGAVAKPLKAMASSIAHTFESIYGNIYKYDNIVEENEKLKAELAELRQEYREYTEVAAENERFRTLFGISSRHSGRVKDPAVVLSWSASNWSSSFTISKGSSNSTVAVGDSVITESGALVGVVSAVEGTWSTVTSIIDTTFSAGALIGLESGVATAVGDFKLMRQGLLMLDFIEDDANIVTGDVIVTSGAGGKFPNGLIIGEVKEVFDYNTDIGRYVTITPAVDLDTVSYVFIVTDFEIMD